jgi:ectoine hydroxylase-related dioxygenase (phytanoyl-CoA dioxygenase family)
MGGESRFHRDRDYGHRPAEINYSVALTPCFGTNAIWIESREGREDYQPMELEPGEMVEFDGASLKHGALHNTTGVCRVSFDFRVVAVEHAGDRVEAEPSWTAKPDPHCFARCPEGVSRRAGAP